MNDDNTVLKLLSILIIGLFLSLWQRVTRKFRVETGRRCMPRKANMQNNFEFSSPSLKFRWLMFLLKISTLMPWSVTFAENKFSLINTYRWRGVCEVCLPKRLLSMRATRLMCGPLFVWPRMRIVYCAQTAPTVGVRRTSKNLATMRGAHGHTAIRV